MPDAVGWSEAELLLRVADALVPDDVQPTEAGLAALRASLDARPTWPASPAAALRASLDARPTWPASPAAARTRRKRWASWAGRSRRGLVALGLIGGISVGGTGVAVATGAPLPEPVRAVAHHLGLPTGSPAPRSGQRAETTGLGPEPARGASTRPAAKVRAVYDLATQPGERGGPDQQRPDAARPPLLSRSGPFEPGRDWLLAGYRRYRPYATGRHPLLEAPATRVRYQSDPDGSVGAQPTPGCPQATKPAGDRRGPGGVRSSGRRRLDWGGRATQTAGGGLD